MVNPSLILGTIPFAALSAALYIPHADERSELLDVAADASAVEAYAVHNVKFEPKHRKRSGDCEKSMKTMKAKKAKNAGKKDAGRHLDAGSKHGTPIVPETVPTGIVSYADPKDVIPDSYIVVLKKDAHPEALATTLELLAEQSGAQVANFAAAGQTDHKLMETSGFKIRHVHDFENSAFRGFSGEFFPEVAEQLAESPEVQFIEKDSKVNIMKPKEEDEAPWGLARVSHRDPLGLSTYNKYLYDGGAGEGVTAYVVDTGIYVDHNDFAGRARWGKTMPTGDTDTDAHGHGSHCAGTIAGSKYGIAKKADVVAVKVLGSDGSGTMSDVIGGVEFVVESHRREKKEKGSKLKGSTANMSLGGGKSPSLDIAVTAATNAGVHFAVAAGNEDQNACNVSPASSEGAVTVGATNVRDERAYFSNWGKCVDIFAPGVNVLSVGTYSPSSSAVMSGTSMASPHIAGLLTYFVSLQPSTDSEYATRGELTTKELKAHLIDYGTPGLLTDLDSDSPNVLAFNGGGGDLSNFWMGEDSEPEHKSFLDKVEDSLENVADYVEDILEDRILDLI